MSPSSSEPPVRIPSPGVACVTALLLVGVLTACSHLGWGRSEGEGGLPPLVLDDDRSAAPEREREAEELLGTASRTLAEGNPARAWDLARRVERSYPGTASSGPALLVRARAALELGRADEGRALLDRYADLLPGDDPRAANLALFDAEELLVGGRTSEGVRAILDLPPDLPDDTRAWALTRLRLAADSLPPAELRTLVDEGVRAHPLSAPILVAAARARWLAGEVDGATRLAEEVLAAFPSGEDADEARALLERIRVEGVPGPSRARMAGTGPFELAVPATVGALLPASGSPALTRYAQQVEEGVRVALEGEDAPEGISVRVVDDGGGPAGSARAMRALETEDAVGVVGPLREEELLAAADARTDAVPIVSPTARSTGGREAVYSLAGPDPGAAHALARYAVESGLEQVVVIHPATESHTLEAEAFRSRMLELGGSVLRVLSYPPGTTTFGEMLETARFLRPRALVLPVPPEDVLALAPQVSFFGLDTLGIRVLGMGAWTEAEVLRDVAPRHTDGVVVATPRPPGGQTEGARAFEEAYERHFRRSLRSPVPALGYDAARLLLQALRSGARDAAELRTALEWIEDFPGATGVLSVEGGGVRREHHLACIQGRELRAIRPGERTRYFRPERRGDPERGEPERVPLGPAQLFCPDVPLPGMPDTAAVPAPGAAPDTAGDGRS